MRDEEYKILEEYEIISSEWICSLDLSVNEDAIIINRSNDFFEGVDRQKGKLYAMRSLVFNGVSVGAACFLKDLMTTFSEAENIDELYNKYTNISIEKIQKDLIAIIDRVKKHGKITEYEELFLREISLGNKSKKALMREFNITYKNIEKAVDSLKNETEWCYGYNHQWVKERVNSLCGGEIDFCWDIESFSKEKHIEESRCREIIGAIISNQKIIIDRDFEHFVILINKFVANEKLELEERNSLHKYINTIVRNIFDAEKRYYLDEAKELIDRGLTHIDDINKYSVLSALDKYKIEWAMEKLGTKPNHHIRRRNKMSDFLE